MRKIQIHGSGGTPAIATQTPAGAISPLVLSPSTGGAAVAPGGMSLTAPGALQPMSERRNLLQYLKQQYGPSFAIQESELRMILPMSNGQSVYTFNPLQNPNSDNVIEMKLNLNDLFATQDVGIYLAQMTVANPGNTELLTFPNNSLKDSTNVVVKDMYTFYNGYLTVSIATTQIYNILPTLPCLYVPQTQQDSVNAAIPATSAWTSPTVGVGTYGPFENQRDGDSGLMKLGNIIQISGGAQNTLALNIPAFSGMKVATVTSGIENIIMLRMKGYIVKNAAYRGAAA